MSSSKFTVGSLVLAIAAVAVLVGGSVAQAGVIEDRTQLDSTLGGDALVEDFESYDIAAGDLVSLGSLTILDHTTAIHGQGPGLVESGVSYISYSGSGDDTFYWHGDGFYSLPTKTIVATGGSGSASTLTLQYDTPVTAMGLDLFDYEGFSHISEVSVYDELGGLIEQVNVSVDGPSGVFFGYEAAAIGSVTLTGNPYGWSSIIDNHVYGVPEPGTLALLAVGAAGLIRRRRA